MIRNHWETEIVGLANCRNIQVPNYGGSTVQGVPKVLVGYSSHLNHTEMSHTYKLNNKFACSLLLLTSIYIWHTSHIKYWRIEGYISFIAFYSTIISKEVGYLGNGHATSNNYVVSLS